MLARRSGLVSATSSAGSSSVSCNLASDPFVPAATPSAVDGFWLGVLTTPGGSLRIQIGVRSAASGDVLCSLDSLDQGAYGIPCANVVYSDRAFAFEIPQVNGRWSGELAADGQTLTGTWTQGVSLPLDLARQAERQVGPTPEPPSFASALPPVAAADMEATLRRDLEAALADGALAEATGVGVAIGVLRDGERRVFAFGSARPDSVFEIESITKTFTGLMLAQLIEQGRVAADQPVRELLPDGSVAAPAGDEITLLDLATQRSGLPRMPDNFAPSDPTNPYADYDAARLYAYLAGHGLARPSDAEFGYSNLGLGLLGQALAERAGVDYAELLRELVTEPLCLRETTVALSAEQRARLIPGLGLDGRPASLWDFDALAGAGAIRSTAGDLLEYLAVQLDPDAACPAPDAPSRSTLAAAVRRSQEPRADGPSNTRIALAWFHNERSGTYWHNGGTGGYNSFAFFNPAQRYAAVVLVNRTPAPRGRALADDLAQHIEQRFTGKPAIEIE